MIGLRLRGVSATPPPRAPRRHRTPSPSPGYERCRKSFCEAVMLERNELRQEMAEVNSARAARSTSREVRGGEDNQWWAAQYSNLEQQLETERREHAASCRSRSHFKRQAVAAEAERRKYAAERADLKAEVHATPHAPLPHLLPTLDAAALDAAAAAAATVRRDRRVLRNMSPDLHLFQLCRPRRPRRRRPPCRRQRQPAASSAEHHSSAWLHGFLTTHRTLAQVSSLRREVARLEAATLAREKAAVVKARHTTITERRKEAQVLQQMQAAAARVAAAEASSAAAEASSAAAEASSAAAEASSAAAEAAAEAAVLAAAEAARLAEARASEATDEAAATRRELMDEQEAAAELEAAKTDSEHLQRLAEQREQRAKVRLEQVHNRLKRFAPPTMDRSVDEWAALSYEAKRQASHREREHLKTLLTSHDWLLADVAAVMLELGWVDDLLMKTRPFFDAYFAAVRALITKLEKEHFGCEFGLYLHYEMRLTLPKILEVTQAASKKYDKATDRYVGKPLLHHPWLKGILIKVPRIAPPTSKLVPLMRAIEKELGVEAGEDGLLAIKSFEQVMCELLSQDPGKHNMPPLSHFSSGQMYLPIVMQLDATGYGSQQFNTIVIRNPYMSASAQQLYILGLGNCSDDRGGSTRLLGNNLSSINKAIHLGNARMEVTLLNNTSITVKVVVYVVLDVSALRHCEHMSNSGWCGCSRDSALRTVPTKPTSIAELRSYLGKCHSPSCEERHVLAHHPLPGEKLPRPCTAAGCKYGHDPATAADELALLLKTEAEFASDKTKAGKARYSKWRMAHASSHHNIQPGTYGKPMFEHHMDNQILDALHLSELGLPKTPWKWGLLNNCSDDARAAIADKLSEWKHPLDTRRKDDNRDRRQKWFNGERWASFMAGERGSPGGPIAIAHLALIMAQDMQANGTEGKDRGPSPKPLPQGGRGQGDAARGRTPGGRGRGRGRAAFTERRAVDGAADEEPPGATRAEHKHVPSAMELAADPEDLAIIRTLYGSRAQTIINLLLAFDAYLNWYYPYKESIPFLAPMAVREARAFENCLTAIDMYEMFERVSICNHKSFLPHAACYKVGLDILQVGDVWAVNLSPLELQNAETKRTARSSGSKRLTQTTSSQTRPSLRGASGPSNLITTKGYPTTAALSVLRHMLATQVLRRGDGIIATPESRRKERLFGVHGRGRTKCLSAGIKLEKLQTPDYDPRSDSCIKAFVRSLKEAAEAQ